jgi:hypothetical protein
VDTKPHNIRRALLLALAMVFLAFAWVWDLLSAVVRLAVGYLPLRRMKLLFASAIDRLPAPLVLLVFLVPFLIVEPLLVVATVAIAMGYVLVGAVAWIILKLLAIALIPAIFDLTQHRLMTMPWFVRAYAKVMEYHHYADRIVEPYKNAAKALIGRWRRRAASLTGAERGVAHRAARFASRKRSGSRRPGVAPNG